MARSDFEGAVLGCLFRGGYLPDEDAPQHSAGLFTANESQSMA